MLLPERHLSRSRQPMPHAPMRLVCHSPPPVPLPQWQRSARQGVTPRRGHRFTMALADSRITVCHQREAGTHNRGSSGTFRPRFRVRFPWLFLAVVCHAGMAHNRSGGAPPQCGRPGRGSNAHQSLAQPVSKRIAPSRLVALAWRSTGPPGAFLHKPQTKPIRQRHLPSKGCPRAPSNQLTQNSLRHGALGKKFLPKWKIFGPACVLRICDQLEEVRDGKRRFPFGDRETQSSIGVRSRHPGETSQKAGWTAVQNPQVQSNLGFMMLLKPFGGPAVQILYIIR